MLTKLIFTNFFFENERFFHFNKNIINWNTRKDDKQTDEYIFRRYENGHYYKRRAGDQVNDREDQVDLV